MSDPLELAERVVVDLDARLAALDDPEGRSDDLDQARRELTVDRALATSHSRLADEVLATDESTLCRECHEPRPCTTSLALAHKYAMPKQLAAPSV